jgi:hypothetical protein
MSQYGAVGIALDYAMEKAPPDVMRSLAWLSTVGFEIRAERGGREEAFGNLLLDWERPPIAVRVVRDRSQWELMRVFRFEWGLGVWGGGLGYPPLRSGTSPSLRLF